MVSPFIFGHCVSRTIKVNTSATFISSYGCYEDDNGNHIDHQQRWMPIEPKHREHDPDENRAQGHHEFKSGIGPGLGFEILGYSPQENALCRAVTFNVVGAMGAKELVHNHEENTCGQE